MEAVGLVGKEMKLGLLERWYFFRRIDWVSELEYPEFTNKEVNRFLNF